MIVINKAPGAPGIPGKWTSSAKSGIGKSLSAFSQVSFTLSHGTLNEVYYPREDNACIRDMELLVTNGNDFFSEEKRDTIHHTHTAAPGVPAYTIENVCKQKRYRIEKEIITDPMRSTLLQRIRFKPLKGNRADYKIYILLAPHIGNMAAGNTGWLGLYKGNEMLFAKRDGVTLALTCCHPWKKASVGYVGTSDGYQDVLTNKCMQWSYSLAENGNIALTAEIDLSFCGDEFTLALGFGRDEYEAAQNARSSLVDGFASAQHTYIKQWEDWHAKIDNYNGHKNEHANRLFRNSVAVMRMHEADRFPGAVIASMSIPWGFDKGDENIGGYHLVWPRDLVQCAGGFIAFSAWEDALRVMSYLIAIQEADGHWPQNMWLEGNPYWNGLQLDQIAFPILLISSFRKRSVVDTHLENQCWDAVHRGISFLIANGPISPQERWEEESGISVSTIATCISALLAAANFAEDRNEPDMAQYLRETADYWNSQIENWLYAKGTGLAQQAGLEGYYIRINPSGKPASQLGDEMLGIKNRQEHEKNVKVSELVSADALALVRFGLRDAKDPKMLNTIKVIDQLLKVDTPNGPAWRRYNNDGYGEKADGSSYDGTGIGRPWPLLTGERAHYEIAAGNFDEAQSLLQAMQNFAAHDLLPEQVWDAEPIPEKDLYPGQHTGSAVPLVWAHAEYVKLCASVNLQRIFDMPEHTYQRYVENPIISKIDVWRFGLPCHFITKGNILRIETAAPATVIWSTDGWETRNEAASRDSGMRIFFTDIPPDKLTGNQVEFTFYWTNTGNWEGKNYILTIS